MSQVSMLDIWEGGGVKCIFPYIYIVSIEVSFFLKKKKKKEEEEEVFVSLNIPPKQDARN
jgi:hypothetical protein